MKKTTYPSYLVDIITDVVLNDSHGNVLYRSHNFDLPQKFDRSKKWQKWNVTHGDAPL